MIIVIDAYNVLKQLMPGREISEFVRTKFIKQAVGYGKRKGHFMVVVFDGGKSPWVERTRLEAGQLIYAGAHETADDVIKHYLSEHRSDDLLLVSSDNDLKQFARRIAVESLDSLNFYNILMNERAGQEETIIKIDAQTIKTTKRNSHDIDELMQQASQMVNEKNEDGARERSRKSSGYTLSKEERALLKKIKKL